MTREWVSGKSLLLCILLGRSSSGSAAIPEPANQKLSTSATRDQIPPAISRIVAIFACFAHCLEIRVDGITAERVM